MQDLTIQDFFAEQVRLRPDMPAISDGSVEVSFSQLDQSSDRVAGWLAEQGIGPEDVVAVEMERGHELVAALLGILKSGAAYLAQEPGTPQSRRDLLIADSGATVMITSSGQQTRTGLPTLQLPLDPHATTVGNFEAPEVHPGGLAYICYTSGSTGNPKGVGVPHQAVIRLVCGKYAEMGPGQTFLFLSPVSFDASTFEIWASLLTGGRLVIHPPGPLVGEHLAEVLHAEKVTTLFLTTALFHRMVEHNLDAFSDLQQLITGGEILRPDYFNRFIDRYPDKQLIAAYGPTENTTFTTCRTDTGPVTEDWVPIGSPITGTTTYILDPDLATVSPGNAGEAYVGGTGLSRGYLRRPAATAMSFVPDPFGKSGQRMYRTGDIVRPNEAGEIEFVGRVDRQVKIRGFRIEPAEVERTMSAVAGVHEAVVVTHRDHNNEKRLTAYLVAEPDHDEAEQLPATVRKKLRGTLPAAMIPSAFVMLDQFPLNQNGKIDRASLPLPDRTARQSETDFVAARSPTEQLLCEMWAEMLQLESVGALDDFFELGGNSLLAMDLISQTEMVYGVELPVRTLLYHPTVEEFAGAIDKLVDHGKAAV